MRTVFIAVLALGMALAGFAVYMAQNYIGHTQAQLDKERALRDELGKLVKVYVVNKPLDYGDPITRDDVEEIYWQEKALPEGVFRVKPRPAGDDPEKEPADPLLFAEGETSPRFVLRQMEKFEPILAIKVTEPGEAAGLTTMLAAGERAFTIKFSDASGASRYLQPGNKVDVYWTGVTSSGQEITQLIETSISIIAVDRPEMDKKKGSANGTNFEAPKAMTVAASPEQVARLTQGQATGKLSVALVAKGDATPVTGPIEVDSNGLLGIEAAEAAPVVQQKVCTIKTRKGGEVVEIPIPCTN